MLCGHYKAVRAHVKSGSARLLIDRRLWPQHAHAKPEQHRAEQRRQYDIGQPGARDRDVGPLRIEDAEEWTVTAVDQRLGQSQRDERMDRDEGAAEVDK